ncbi:hypothetical protein LLH03_17885 [bacterium]|nr:hypothetical protein [bacterium]
MTSKLLALLGLCGLLTVTIAAAGPGELPAPGDTTATTPAVPSPDLLPETEGLMYAALQQGDYDRALLVLDNAKGKGLPLGQYQLMRAKVFSARQDPAAEETELRGAIYRDPTLTEAYLRLAGIMENRGLWLDATDLYRSAIKCDPKAPGAYLQLARILSSQERDRSALDILEDARKVAPEAPQVLAALGAQYQRMGDRKHAVDDYRHAARVAQEPLLSQTQLKVASLSLELGDYMTAFAYFRAVSPETLKGRTDLYPSIGLAADNATWTLFDPAWTAFDDYYQHKPTAHERVEVYAQVTRAQAEAKEIAKFLDRVTPPDNAKSLHASRTLYVSLVCEALTDALAYLDTGDAALAQAATDRRVDALGARKVLQRAAR